MTPIFFAVFAVCALVYVFMMGVTHQLVVKIDELDSSRSDPDDTRWILSALFWPLTLTIIVCGSLVWLGSVLCRFVWDDVAREVADHQNAKEKSSDDT